MVKKSCYRILIFNKWSVRSDKDGVYNWPQYSRGSKKPATHTQQKITHVSPLGGVSNTYSSAIISILAMVPLSTFF